MSKWVGDDKMIKRFCFNGLKLKLIVISFFRDRKGPQQPVSNQRLREGASQSARSCRSPHHTHRKSLCSCQRTSRGECPPFPTIIFWAVKVYFGQRWKKLLLSILCRILSLKNIKWGWALVFCLFLQQSLALERKSLTVAVVCLCYWQS